jgi:hypothetical protein
MQADESKVKYMKVAGVILAALYFGNCIRTPDTFHLIGAVNLIIHEAGHWIFIFFGEFMHVLGGSLTQILIPAIFAGYFFLRRDNYSGGVMLMWMGENFVEVARYASDAMFMRLPLLGGDNVIHDWNFLLSELHILRYTDTVGSVIHTVGIFVVLAGIALAGVYAVKGRGKENVGNSSSDL